MAKKPSNKIKNKAQAIAEFVKKYDSLKAFAIPRMEWRINRRKAYLAWAVFVNELVSKERLAKDKADRWTVPEFPVRTPKKGGAYHAPKL